MTERQLSPGAQAVLHSFWDAPVSPARNCQIATALRAAAERLGYTIYDYENNEHPSVVNVADILAIADELEETLP
jgi:hypothetical protein